MAEQKSEIVQHIILGLGKFMIDDIPVLLTRGGGQFIVEREYRIMEADGMKSAGKDMIVIDREQPKLTMNMLSIFTGADLTKLYPATKSTKVTGDDAGTEITATDGLVISDEDYHKVTWIGKTNKGRPVKIEIGNAINLENIDWTLVDKDEVIQVLTYTGTADLDIKQCEWKVKFLDLIL